MKDIFLFSAHAVLPIILLVLLGYFIKKIGFGSKEFYKTANSMVYRVFLPVMLFYNIYKIESLSKIDWALVLYFCLAIVAILLFGFLIAVLVTKDKKKIPVLVQCAYRSNHAIIGIPLAESIGGSGAVLFAAVISSVAIPLYNTLAVIVLSFYKTGDTKNRFKSMIISTITNPMILGCIAGIIVLVIRRLIPLNEAGELAFSLEQNCPSIINVVSNIAKLCSPFALIILGAQFDFFAVKALYKEIIIGTLLRLVAAPAIGLGGAVLFSKVVPILDISINEYPGLIALFGSPVAVASAVMVSEIGGDEQLANQLVVWTSVLSMFTVFLIVFILKSAALI